MVNLMILTDLEERIKLKENMHLIGEEVYIVMSPDYSLIGEPDVIRGIFADEKEAENLANIYRRGWVRSWFIE